WFCWDDLNNVYLRRGDRMTGGNAIHRRSFLTLLCGTSAAWPLAARAQQDGRVRRIGIVSPNTERDPVGRSYRAVFYEALRKLGWVDGRNIRIDFRWGEGDGARIRQQVTELVATAPEMIVASGTPAAVALKQMTSTIPVVFISLPDPIANGLVASIARPGGN